MTKTMTLLFHHGFCHGNNRIPVSKLYKYYLSWANDSAVSNINFNREITNNNYFLISNEDNVC